jgi:hypothetical protein
MTFFEIVTQTKYMIKTKCIDNIEDTPDEFISGEDLLEQYPQFYTCVPNYDYPVYDMEAIKQDLATYKNTLITTGEKKVVMNDDLVQVLTQSDISLSQLCPGTKRQGTYLVIPKKKIQKIPNQRNFQMLVANAEGEININLSGSLLIKIYCAWDNQEEAINLLKKLINWEDLDWKDFDPTEEQLNLMKQIWDNPSIFNK